MKKLFIGLDDTNLGEFVSPCCQTGLTTEPPSKVCCGMCGKQVLSDDAIPIEETS